MISNRNHQNMTESFITTQVVARGLDERTAKAYRLDLERFYLWLEAGEADRKGSQVSNRREGECVQVLDISVGENVQISNRSVGECIQILDGSVGKCVQKCGYGKQEQSVYHTSVSDEMEAYLEYLSREKGLRASTISRKQWVFGSYLAYLASQGILKQYEPLKPVGQMISTESENTSEQQEKEPEDKFLSKKEVDMFFQAIDREYEELDSDFRRRVCLRDQVMMKLLFYHGIEISELLRLEVTDYDRKEAVLTIYGKRGKVRSVKVFSRTLKIQMEEWLEEHAWFERDEEHLGRMFLSKMGKPLSMKMVINIFDKYRELAGIEKVCKPKDLKNSLGRYAKEMVVELG